MTRRLLLDTLLVLAVIAVGELLLWLHPEPRGPIDCTPMGPHVVCYALPGDTPMTAPRLAHVFQLHYSRRPPVPRFTCTLLEADCDTFSGLCTDNARDAAKWLARALGLAPEGATLQVWDADRSRDVAPEIVTALLSRTESTRAA